MKKKNVFRVLLWPAFCFAAAFLFSSSIILAASPDPPPENSITLGCLLPLSGQYGRIGNRILNGAELSLHLHNLQKKGPPVKLLFIDTCADPLKTRLAYEQMAEDDTLIAIIGPVAPQAFREVAAAATKARVPLLVLTTEEGIAEESPFIFRNSFTPAQEARALVNHATHVMGLHRFAILYPRNSFGKLWKDLFSKEVTRQGGEIAGSDSYLSGQKDFSPSLMRIADFQMLPFPFAPGQYPSLSSAGIDALFIPDRFDVVSQIASKLPDFNLRGIPLLGTHLWNDAQVAEKAGNYEGKILFVDGFFKGSRYGFVQEFVDIFYQTFGKEPGIFEATGYDTMNILLFLVREKKIASREALRTALIHIKGYPGVTGATSFNEKGESTKVLYYLTIQNGTIQQIN